MNEKKYKQRTKVLGIPVLGDGDYIVPEVELRKYQIIENMLLASTSGIKNCLFSEGDLALEKAANETFIVVLRANGGSASATGIIGRSYFSAPSIVRWEGLVVGKRYYLYLVGSPKTLVEPSMVRPVVSEFEKKEVLGILMGTVDLTGPAGILERVPDGKVYARDLMRHISDDENPHGEFLLQDGLVIRKKMVLDEQAEIEIRRFNEELLIPSGCLLPQVVDFMTAGKEGIVIKFGAKVSFVNACRMAGQAAEKTLGEVSIGYYGKDEKVLDNKSVVVYNTGDTDIFMRAIVFFG